MKQAYITALTAALLNTKDIDGALGRAHALLVKKGHIKLWPVVLRGVEKALLKKEIDDTPRLIVAKESAKEGEAIKVALAKLSVVTNTPKVEVDSSLIGGFVVQYKDRMVDHSYKRALIDLYRKVTK